MTPTKTVTDGPLETVKVWLSFFVRETLESVLCGARGSGAGDFAMLHSRLLHRRYRRSTVVDRPNEYST